MMPKISGLTISARETAGKNHHVNEHPLDRATAIPMALIDLAATIAGHSTPHRVEGKALEASDVAIFGAKTVVAVVAVGAMHRRHGHDFLGEGNGSVGVEQTTISQLLPKVDADISLVILSQKETIVPRGRRFSSLGGALEPIFAAAINLGLKLGAQRRCSNFPWA